MTPDPRRPPAPHHYAELVRRELATDLGSAGDVTTDVTVPAGTRGTGRFVARREGRVCGLDVALSVFDELRGAVRDAVHVEVQAGDGDDVETGGVIARVEGSARLLLSGERTALNLLGHLSGVATVTRDLVRLVADAGPAVVTCTRKTTPGLRALEKYAVRVGGGVNHRFGLHDAVLIKDNHREMAGGVAPAVVAARAALGHLVKLEAEVDTLPQLAEALDAGVDAVLLDNMTVEQLRQAVEMARGRATTEASGGITSQSIQAVAATGVDVISVGWITHSAPAFDVSLDLTLSPPS
tara:strand:- start:637 stop:1524 length:888 start_codon:yes stop_codon:yes gene_type:complete